MDCLLGQVAICGQSLDILIPECQGRHPDVRVNALRVGGVGRDEVGLQSSTGIGEFRTRKTSFAIFTLMTRNAATQLVE